MWISTSSSCARLIRNKVLVQDFRVEFLCSIVPTLLAMKNSDYVRGKDCCS